MNRKQLEVNILNKKYLLFNLIDQLEEKKIDSLIDVVKGMVNPSIVENHFEEQSPIFTPSVREANSAQYIITQNINDSFN